jgi:hypothetical protein
MAEPREVGARGVGACQLGHLEEKVTYRASV